VASPWSIMVGEGFGNTFRWDFDYSEEIRSVSADMVDDFFQEAWLGGHSPFTYASFFGGIVGVIWQLYIFGRPFLLGWQIMPGLRTVVHAEILRLFAFALLAILLSLADSFTSNPLGERLAAQFLGIAIGMLLGLPKLFARVARPQSRAEMPQIGLPAGETT